MADDAGFSDPVVGGQNLIRPAIQSPNYVAGSAGWSINRDGSAEFNAATVRGTASFGTPGGVREDFVTPPNIPSEISAGFNGTPIFARIFWVGDATYPRTYWFELFEQVGGSAGGYLHYGWVLNGLVKRYQRMWFQVPTSMEFFLGGDPNNDIDLYCNSLKGREPGVGTPPLSGIESWHALTLQNSWANRGAGFPVSSYRMVPAPANCVQLVGQVTGGTTGAGPITLATLPANYRPATSIAFPVANAGATAVFEVQTDGKIQMYNIGVGALPQFTVLIPLDL